MDLPQTLLELGGIILGLALLGRLATMIGLSPIPFFLLGGLLFGVGGVIPLQGGEVEFIELGAQLGVILLLFMLGLEYSAKELVTNLKTHWPSGVLDFILNAFPGAVVGVLMGWGPGGIMAMAGVTYATSSGIAAKVMGDLGRVGNRETPIVMSVLVLEYLLMAIYLPILTTLLAGVGVKSGVISLAGALAAVAVVLVISLKFGAAINKFLFSPNDEMLLLGVLGMVLLVAGFAEEMHVSMAVGAFLVGIALSGPVAERAEDLITPIRDLFAAVFFVFFGMQTDARLVPPLLGSALLLGAITAATKIFVGMWSARRAGIALPGQVRAGTIMVPRGEFNIIIAGLATSAGIGGIGPFAAAYVMVMAITGPILTRYADPIAHLFDKKRREKGKKDKKDKERLEGSSGR